ncbi:MAG: hypothetical protein HY270_11510 [Deltaproteobacteria bacterium]|nr:hypothetical protein [Deltaproteobacteria bacterium]
MKLAKLMMLGAVLMGPAVAWAGRQILVPAPAIHEAGLVALGVALVGAGIRYLRRK